MNINRSDVIWNYAATLMRVASGVIVLPLIIKMLPVQDIGLWTGVMLSLNGLIAMFDFGFSPTVNRNITYIYSGASSIQSEGVKIIEADSNISYPLLKGLLKSVRIYYASISVLMALIFFTGGYFYIEKLLVNYNGDIVTTKLAWYLYGALLCYQFYTYYYDTILIGRGYIKRSKQIIVFSQSLHIVIASILLSLGVGIISLVISQSIATIVNKTLARRSFYDEQTVKNLSEADEEPWTTILKKLWSTAYKSGLSSMSWALANRMLPILAAWYIPLSMMGSYGLSKTVVDLTYSLSIAWFMTYYPKLTKENSHNSILEVKRLYIKAQIISILIIIIFGTGALLFGDWGLKVISKESSFLLTPLFALFFVSAMFDSLTNMSTFVILSKNQVPYYKAQTITALVTVLLLFISLEYISTNIAFLIIVPFVAQLAYQHWKWFFVVWKLLDIKVSDYTSFIGNTMKKLST